MKKLYICLLMFGLISSSFASSSQYACPTLHGAIGNGEYVPDAYANQWGFLRDDYSGPVGMAFFPPFNEWSKAYTVQDSADPDYTDALICEGEKNEQFFHVVVLVSWGQECNLASDNHFVCNS